MNADAKQAADQLVATVIALGGSPELTDLIRESMHLAYATGLRDGVREVQAILHAQDAMQRMRRPMRQG